VKKLELKNIIKEELKNVLTEANRSTISKWNKLSAELSGPLAQMYKFVNDNKKEIFDLRDDFVKAKVDLENAILDVDKALRERNQ